MLGHALGDRPVRGNVASLRRSRRTDRPRCSTATRLPKSWWASAEVHELSSAGSALRVRHGVQKRASSRVSHRIGCKKSFSKIQPHRAYRDALERSSATRANVQPAIAESTASFLISLGVQTARIVRPTRMRSHRAQRLDHRLSFGAARDRHAFKQSNRSWLWSPPCLCPERAIKLTAAIWFAAG